VKVAVVSIGRLQRRGDVGDKVVDVVEVDAVHLAVQVETRLHGVLQHHGHVLGVLLQDRSHRSLVRRRVELDHPLQLAVRL